MPRRDGTGPNGMGSRTGRGLGACTGVNAPFFGQGLGAGYGRGGLRARNGLGNGFGPGFRGGRGNWGGRGWLGQAAGYAAGYVETSETLAERAAMLEAELAEVKRRMETMEQENAG
ncbi:MAG: DUF5320 domain-containing protein [Desulfovibrionaceae bacterium]|nr:DUF5320 domain-containing protein [Desulfovibrionaceae bacterium]